LRKGCKTVPVSVLVRLDVKNQLHSRCDLKGCDDYPARFTPSGIFIVIDVPRKGMVAKMAMNGSQFVEVVTTGINAIGGFGSCK